MRKRFLLLSTILLAIVIIPIRATEIDQSHDLVDKKSTVTKILDTEDMLHKKAYYFCTKNMKTECFDTIKEIESLYYFSSKIKNVKKLKAEMLYLNKEYAKSIKEIELLLELVGPTEEMEYYYYLRVISYDKYIKALKKSRTKADTLLKSIKEFQLLYPNSKYRNIVADKAKIIRSFLLEREINIGRLHQKNNNIIAALVKFNNILNSNIDDPELMPEVLYRLCECSYSLGIDEDVKRYLKILLEKYPDSVWSVKIAKKNELLMTIH